MHVALFGVSFLPKVGGMEYAMHYLANALVELGVDVTVIAQRFKGTMPATRAYAVQRYGLPFRGGYRTYINRLSGRCALASVHRRQPIDVVNIHSVAEAPEIALPFLLKHRIPIVMTPHGEDVQRVPAIRYGIRLDPHWDRVVCANLRQAHIITAISESVRGELPVELADRTFRIPNGIAPGVFCPGKSNVLQRKCGLDDSARLVISVGRNHIKKGYADGIAAFAEAAREPVMTGWHYAIIGNGVASLDSVVERFNLRGRVFLIEQLGPSELKECYRSAAVFFSPSIVEGLSLVSIEAMACGLPLVATNVPGNADIVLENNCGIIVPPQDPRAMAAALVKLASDEDYRRNLSRIAARSATKYEWPAVAKQYLEAYKKALLKNS